MFVSDLKLLKRTTRTYTRVRLLDAANMLQRHQSAELGSISLLPEAL